MGLALSIQKAIDEHKEKIAQPHFLFSAEAPKHPNMNEVQMGHDDVMEHLKGAGYDAHTINADTPAKGILIYGVAPDVAEALHELCGRLGQESSVYSDGQNHEIRYHHGDNKGKSFRGVGTQFYDSKPEGPCSSLPGGAGFFQHNLDDEIQKAECFHAYTEAKLEALLKDEKKDIAKPDAAPAVEQPTEERRQVPRATTGAPPKIGVGVHDSYKQRANEGANVMWRTKIKGRKMLAQGIPLHMTLKTFNDPKDIPHDEIRQKVNELGLERPDPKKLRYETTIFHSQRDGKPYYMLKIHGTDPRYAQFYEHFKGRGITYPQFMGHVTIDKDLYDQINREGIDHRDVEFSPLMIEHGANNPTHLFQDSKSGTDHQSDVTPKKLNPVPGGEKGPIPFPQAVKTKKLAASEDFKRLGDGQIAMDSKELVDEHEHLVNVLESPSHKDDKMEARKQRGELSQYKQVALAKGSLKHAAVAVGAAAAMAGAPNSTASIQHTQTGQEQTQNGYSSHKMLGAIAQVESEGGKNTQHEVLGGMHQGERAYGKYGLTPELIRETVGYSRELKNRHGPLTALKGDALHNYMADNPGLEDQIAQKHLSRLEHHFGQDPEKIGYAWLNGVTGTYQAARNKTDFASHWHVKKLMNALKGNT